MSVCRPFAYGGLWHYLQFIGAHTDTTDAQGAIASTGLPTRRQQSAAQTQARPGCRLWPFEERMDVLRDQGIAVVEALCLATPLIE